jgi:hypothetical protein
MIVTRTRMRLQARRSQHPVSVLRRGDEYPPRARAERVGSNRERGHSRGRRNS